MSVLIKLGGTLLDSAETKARLAGEIATAVGKGVPVIVVHGGGKQMTRYLSEHGVESRFVNGLRVTTAEVLDAVLKVFAGTVNRELVAALIAAGTSAVGLTGMDGLLTEASQISEELGFVGKPVRSQSTLLDLLIENGYLPVVACVAGDRQGHFYNVNADQMAVSIAAAMKTDKLLFLTDVDGVRGQDNTIYSKLTLQQCRELIESGVASGGMRAKLEAASEGLRSGVHQVVIAPGATPGIIAQLLAGGSVGTMIVEAKEVSGHA